MKGIGILGAGSWGTALAVILAQNGHDVTLWARRGDLVDEINHSHTNNKFLKQLKLPLNIKASTSIEDVVDNKDVVLFVIPSHCMRDVAREASKWIKFNSIIVSATKGFEPGSYKRMSEVLQEELSSVPISVISGPSHAEEVVQKCPTTIVVSSNKDHVAKDVQELFSNSYFRVYTNSDIVGVEVGGALKNIIAIAAGLVDGLRFGDNTKAALVTRGLAEIIRLGKKMGAKPITFVGLAGLGDLVVTCMSQHSRNWKAGFGISQGKGLDEVLQDMEMVVEGVQTTRAAYALSKVYNVEMPLTEELYRVLFENKDPSKAVIDLMNRGITAELDELL